MLKELGRLLIAIFLLSMAMAYAQQDAKRDPVESATGEARSPHWPKVRGDYLKDHPVCAVCGTKEKLEVHHVVPFHKDRSKELDPTNLITLCPDHHLLFGHLMDWKSYNPHVREDAAEWAKKIKNRPK